MSRDQKPHELIAVATLGMGAAPGEIQACRADPKAWIENQIENPGRLIKGLREAPSTGEISDFARRIRQERRQLRKPGKTKGRRDKKGQGQKDKLYGFIGERLQLDINLRHEQAIKTSTSFCERWFRFWANRFTVSARNNFLKMVTGCFEREAIRPHMFGRFEDMLKASTLHPAMLYYLDNNQSFGPNSPMGRRKGGNINENLAREVLELHTMGIGGGYSLEDIQGLAKALTGWRHSGPPRAPREIFFKPCHEPGPTSFLGKTYKDAGQKQIFDVLTDLAKHTSTARHIAQQLVAHFIPGDLSETSVDKLTKSFLDSGGDLKQLALDLVNLEAIWTQTNSAFKTPDEFLVSIGRSIPDWDGHFNHKFPKLLGQPVMQASSPEGWEMTGENWINAENILIRLGGIRRAMDGIPNWVSTEMFLDDNFGGHLSRRTQKLIHAQKTRENQILIALMSPEFLRR